jgi:AraC family transcriptional regulator
MTSISGSITAHRAAMVGYPPGATLGPRVRHDFEFVWILEGDAEWTWLDRDQRQNLTPGALLLTRPGMHEQYHWGRDQPTRHGYVHFAVTPEPETTAWPVLRPVVPPGPIGGMLDYLLWLSEDPAESAERHVPLTIATLLALFLDAPLPDGSAAPESPILTAVIDYVRRAWAAQMRPMSLTELARAGAVSKEHLARLFHRRYGVGPVSALELVRLDRAETLLARSNFNITEIAQSCGYPDPLHFSRRFHHSYGMSPRAYRRDGPRRSPLAEAGLLPLTRRLSSKRP